MANCRRITQVEKKVITMPVEVEIQTDTLNLQLSGDEAATLLMILRKVGGSPEHSHRKHAKAILESLKPYFKSDDYNQSVYYTNIYELYNKLQGEVWDKNCTGLVFRTNSLQTVNDLYEQLKLPAAGSSRKP